jgi:two-component system chemotaxis sensor kinase CheA
MPVRPVFERMARLTRDLAKKSGKRIRFTMSGEDTEVDKGIVERISDPLTHMIRNAVDHGIETSPEERRIAGKTETGHIELRAFHRSSSILIEVADDGRGLDREAILAKARERGVITDEQSMSDQEVFKLIFRAGLSTAKKVTDVSGRGVGMDVVTRNIQSLRGQVRIDSVQGKGTTFSMRLPLTLAIIEGMVISVAGERFIVPTLSVVESLRPTKEELAAVLQQGEMVSVRGQLLPLYRLSRLFGISGAEEDPTRTLVVIIEHEGVRAGLMIDSIVGQQQTVIKSLGSILSEVTGISGATIMSDGRVGLILDPAGIMRLATS